MDTILESDAKTSMKSLEGFMKNVFDTSKASQAEVFNASQFAILALGPSYGLLRLLREYVPDPDDYKSSIEIAVEVVLQVVSIVLGIIVIDRAVMYVPTFSGTPYADTPGYLMPLLPFIIILLTVQTKLGLKTDILFNRLVGLIYSTSQPPRASNQQPDTAPAPLDYLPREGFDNPHEEKNASHASHAREEALRDKPKEPDPMLDKEHDLQPFALATGGGGSLQYTPFLSS
tara:strand:- start:18337 stop:19029 length:693 start_codon:yes stop_codon:yes gene_type:complete